MRFAVAAASVAGPSHIAAGESSQDAFLRAPWRGGWLLAVADGLGSHAHSATGSKAACRAGLATLRRVDSDADSATIHALIHAEWLGRLGDISPKEAGSTLLLARVDLTGECWISQLGDGLALISESGHIRPLGEERSGFGNHTACLGLRHEPAQWTHGTFQFHRPGDGLMLMTDGISDDLIPEKLPSFFNAVQSTLVPLRKQARYKWLERELIDWPTPCHGDDKTLLSLFYPQ